MGTWQREPPPVPAQLGLWDATSIVVGVVIGVGIYESPPLIFQQLSGPWEAMGAWALGGLLSLIGALCFAELASTYPRSGGEYVYLTRAYGSWVGFFFAWAQLAVIRTGGGIALLAYVFADYAATLHDVAPSARAGITVAYATLAILVLTLLNVLGVNPGKRTQNVLTVTKVLGVLGVVLAGFLWAGPRPETAAPGVVKPGSFALAMIFVLYAYDGWNEAVYVATEVQDRRRNLPLALLLGTGAVTIIYLLINAAYLAGLGFSGAQASTAIAGDVLARPLGAWGARAMGVLIMVSALGALNGMILTASRIYPELGADHRALAPLAWWHPRLGTPVCSLLVQAAISVAMVGGVASWWHERGGFDALVRCTTPVFWFFFLLTGVALFVLRFRDRQVERPFRVPLYPWVPLVFCGWSAYMLYGSLRYASEQAWVGIAILLAGLPLYLLSRWGDARAGNPEAVRDRLTRDQSIRDSSARVTVREDRIMGHDQALREHLLSLLRGGNAHLDFESAIADLPRELRGAKPPGVPHSPWRLLEHLRIAQWDILEFSRNPRHVSPKFPEGYWPKGDAPPDDAAWEGSVAAFRADLQAMQDLVADPATDLFARIPHGDGQTVLREALLVADHNAYHLGQLVVVRRALGAWPGE